MTSVTEIDRKREFEEPNWISLISWSRPLEDDGHISLTWMWQKLFCWCWLVLSPGESTWHELIYMWKLWRNCDWKEDLGQSHEEAQHCSDEAEKDSQMSICPYETKDKANLSKHTYIKTDVASADEYIFLNLHSMSNWNYAVRGSEGSRGPWFSIYWGF